MKCTVIKGTSGSGKTQTILDRLSRTSDNLVITTDPAVFYIETYMSMHKIPGKCVGISSLSNFVLQEISGSYYKEASKEVEIMLISKIMKEHDDELTTFHNESYLSGMADKIHSFIIECKEENITPDKLLSAKNDFAKLLKNKVEDIALIYRYFEEELKKKKLVTKEDILLHMIEMLGGSSFKYTDIYVDTLDRYNKNTKKLLYALLRKSENFTIAFKTSSPKAADKEICEESTNAMTDLFEEVKTVPACALEVINSIKHKNNDDGIAIIERELFNRGTITKSTANNVILHEASCMYKEVDFVISKIKDLVSSGYKYSDIVVTTSNMNRYINIINSAFIKSNIPYYYFKNDTVNNTFLYSFLDAVLDVAINGENTTNIIQLVHQNFLNLTTDEVITIDTFFNRFGDDLEVALQNGEKFDSENYVKVKYILDKILLPIKKITNADNNITSILSAFYNYLAEINITSLLMEKANIAKKEGYIQASKELVTTWNDVIDIMNSINMIFVDNEVSLDEFKIIFEKMCAEKITKNQEQFHNQVCILDMDNAQNKKSKILFVIGCNEGYMPEPLGVPLINDKEKSMLNNSLKSEFKLSRVYTNFKYATISNVLTLPQHRLYISWSLYDMESKELRYASIINNIVKTFEDNIVRERTYYDNDKEEKFISLLNALSDYLNKGIQNDEVDNIFFQLSSDPEYSQRLKVAVENAALDKRKINATNIMDAYKEKEYFAVTRLERFNECPFKHYVDYALSPERIKLFEETAADKGNYYHYTSKKFFDMIKSGSIDIEELTKVEFEKIIDKILEEIEPEHNENILNSNARNRYYAQQMRSKAIKSIWAAVEQIKASRFEVAKNEYIVGRDVPLTITLDSGKQVNVVGTIDRLDTTKIGDKDYARIIDYKSGNVTFSEDLMEAGIQLQLPIYSKAVGSEFEIAGMYYFHIQDPINDADNSSNSKLKDYKLSGPTLKNDSVILNSDEIFNEGSGVSSDIVSVELTTKGEVSKRSKVLTNEELTELLEKANEVIQKTVDNILNGTTNAYPLKHKDFNACEYCPYHSLCHFDSTIKNCYRRYVKEVEGTE